MRKIIFFLKISLLIIFIFLFSKPDTILSQGPNEFGCIWTNPRGLPGCFIDPSRNNCNPPYLASSEFCNSQPQNSCNTAIGTCSSQPLETNINFRDLITLSLPRWDPDTTLGEFIWALLPYIFSLAGFLILIFIILGGYQILTSRNDPKAIAQGQQKITYAIIGLVVALSAYLIVRLTAGILDLQPIENIFQGGGGPRGPHCNTNVGDPCLPCCQAPLHCDPATQTCQR